MFNKKKILPKYNKKIQGYNLCVNVPHKKRIKICVYMYN